ncbi:MAG: PQQ-binding-like beta-propeller repeat protein [Acidimicrobiaceae bacterium]|nr:PQQ-binding-like beta-propeller repeat protein [Acidimicrobiaceae bacterium]
MIGLRVAVAGAVLVAGACSQPTAEDPAVTTAAPDTTTTTDEQVEPEPATETATTTATPDTTTTAAPDATTTTEPAEPEPAEPEPAPEAPEPAMQELPERSGWSIQIGTEDADTTYGVSAAPGGDLVVAAATQGSLAGDNQGQRDVYLARYSPSGELRWSIQTGGPMNDSPLGVSVAPDGSIYVGGFTDGDFASANQGSADVWLARFDADGNELWRRQFGGPAWDRGFDVTAFDGGAYITGYTASTLDPATDLGGFDGFAARYDADGNQQWIRHIGTDATDWGQGSALAPDGGLYMTGYTEGALVGSHAGDKDLFAVRINVDGSLAWATQLGTAALDWTQGVGAGPDGGMLIAGSTEGALAADHAGERDMLVVSLDAGGKERWRWQAGTEGMDTAFEVRQTGEFIVVTGTTAGSLAGADAALGERDAVLVWLDLAGNLLAMEQFGTGAVDDATGVDVSADGSVVWSGYTYGSYQDAGAGGADLLFGRLELGS